MRRLVVVSAASLNGAIVGIIGKTLPMVGEPVLVWNQRTGEIATGLVDKVFPESRVYDVRLGDRFKARVADDHNSSR